MSLEWKKATGLEAELADAPQELREWALSLPTKEMVSLRRAANDVGQALHTALHFEFFGRFGREPKEQNFNG